MSRVWKSKQELCELAVRLRHTNGAGPQSASLQAESRHARAFAWFYVLDDVIHLWAEEARAAALKPAAPIVWDGSDEAGECIEAATKHITNEDGYPVFRVNGGPPSRPRFLTVHTSVYQDGFVFLVGWRIQIVGDSFVILPPEVTA